jgi:hypothetical protein
MLEAQIFKELTLYQRMNTFYAITIYLSRLVLPFFAALQDAYAACYESQDLPEVREA